MISFFFQEKSESEQSLFSEGTSTNILRKSNSNGDVSLTQRANAHKFVITEETQEEANAEQEQDNEQYDDETASKGSKESKESENEKVINTMYDNEKDSLAAEAAKIQMLRRKSMAPPVLHE